MKPFTEGAFQLKEGTRKAAAVMPYYTISTGIDPSGKNVGNSYSKYIIGDLLRGRFGYDGVVCTDWGVLKDISGHVDDFAGKSWGMETATEGQRHYAALEAGVDQFGGNNDKGPVLEAYEMGVKEHGEAAMTARFRLSARREAAAGLLPHGTFRKSLSQRGAHPGRGGLRSLQKGGL